ncbi:hypothetical protein ACFE04_008806 [Oxalis oulophora]
MESNIDSQKGKQDNDVSLNKSSKDRSMLGENAETKKLVRRLDPDHALILNVKQLKTGKICTNDSLHQNIFVLDGTIPKHMVTVDEKYLRRCLELIHISKSEISSHEISLNLNSEIRSEHGWELRRFVFDSPSPTNSDSVMVSPAEHWIDGSIMGSKSMVNLLNSPLFRKFGVIEDDAYFKETGLSSVEESISYDFVNSPSTIGYYSPQIPGKPMSIIHNGSEAAPDRFVSVSSTTSTSSDQSTSTSTSALVTITHGVLQCMWKGEVPQFIFNVDDQRESYVASLRKTDSLDDVYLFHSRKDGQKESEIHNMESSQLVGKMKISTTFTLCENNSKIMEKEFVFFGNENFIGDTHSSGHNIKKNKGLSKVVKALKNSHSKFRGSSATLEKCSFDPNKDSCNDLDVMSQINLLHNNLPPNLELATVIVKEHLPDNHEEKVGGWGLNFLKKVKQSSQISSASSACSVRNSADCSSSIDVLVPAGLHGGPISINGGPSSLYERWRSDGQCDCGGWDLGCPLTVLGTKQESFPQSQADTGECCKFVDFFIKGSEHGAPTLRIVNIREGLYFVNFRSTVSALQSFSIAVAYIHSESPSLRPKNIEEVN